MIILTSDMKACSFQNWYPLFKDHTAQSIVIPICNDVVSYLLEDSTLVLPEEVYNSSAAVYSDHEGDCLDLENTEETSSEIKQPSFPAFSKALKDGINQLGGEVFIKLNWTAPVDAAWITSTKSLKCTSLEDIYLLLKSSDLLVKDLTCSMQQQPPSSSNSCIVLRKWQNIDPGNEFRCFVCKQQLIAISQRDYKVYYGHLTQRKYQIMEEITTFFKEKIKGNFPIPNYTFDIVRHSSNKIQIIDFSPFDPKRTLPLLFTWGDLCAKERNLNEEIPTVEFRILGEDPGILPNSHARYGFPQDLISRCANGNDSSVMNYVAEEVESERMRHAASEDL